MRNSLVFLMLILAACGGNDDGPNIALDSLQHLPEISSLTISPDSAAFMDGDGSVVVTAEIEFRDIGRDIETLYIRMPDGTIIESDQVAEFETGMLAETFSMPTDESGTFLIEIWLVDNAGDRSARRGVWFFISEFEWISRLTGLPYSLNDVVWTGSVFIAVGEQGSVFRSADGINWDEVQSGTNANLYAVAADGPDIVAVGFELEGGPGIILQSRDHGASWTIKHSPAEVVLQAVAINASQIVVGGVRWGRVTAITLISEDGGDTWHAVDSWPDENIYINDLVYRDGMFVASTNSLARRGTWVTVSPDGKLWNEIAVSDEDAVLRTIFHDDSQYILAGSGGVVFTSPDGINWTELPSLVRDVSYTGGAWSGSTLMVAGGSMCGGMWICDSTLDVPVGLTSTDGGASWEIFNIDGDYESKGLAWGNGRFVSVGEKSRFSGEGAIYTAD